MLVEPVGPRTARHPEPVAATAGAPCVRLRGVVHDHGGRGRALDIESLDIAGGELVAVVGPRGSGKSTLLGLIGGRLAPSRGVVLAGDRPVVAAARRPSLQPWLSVRIEPGPRLRAALGGSGVGSLAGRRPGASGLHTYERLAHALAHRRQPVLLDDPFRGVDALSRERLQAQLHRLWRATRPTVIFTTDSLEEAAYLGSRVMVLGPQPGRVIVDAVTPFGAGPRPRGARTSAELTAFRERLARELAIAIADDSF